MDQTPNLSLPYIAPAQAQKHVTHNEAIRALDALVQLTVADRGRTEPPLASTDGDRHIVASAAQDAWAGKDGMIAAFQDGAWHFYPPAPGWVAWVRDDGAALVFTNDAWQPLVDLPEVIERLGINASADDTNRLTVAADASLFNNAGTGHQIKINKAASGDTASLLFQTGYSGRAEFGTPGDDAFRIKVSEDGITWYQSVTIDPASGHVGIATDAPTTTLHVNGPLRVQSYALASLPSPADSGSGAILHVWDEAGGSVLAFSDGGTWRRVTDRAPVS
ncbi:DUF2793 domain-containing protein [Pararhizobium haloflavum]|uniref:DUF2793 domain-containing protein n=1 Tax=Pararhizobium haloflavum TaxID=2037914 RepID=UPI000C17731C|nr:DUF2793 domain-containing protein [Pararhizobium haloflavum]